MLALLVKVVLTTFAVYKPVHVMYTHGYSCGAAERFMKETVKLKLTSEPENVIYVNHMKWLLVDDVEDGFHAHFQVNPQAHMFMDLYFGTDDSYLIMQGIDSQRRPCQDMVYLRRVR